MICTVGALYTQAAQRSEPPKTICFLFLLRGEHITRCSFLDPLRPLASMLEGHLL